MTDHNPVSSHPAFTGGCSCGRVRFQLQSAPIVTHCCHCRVCQKVSGSAFRVNAMIESDRMAVLQGAPEAFQGVASHKQIQCPDCKTALWSHHPELGEAIAFVGVGVLDHGERLPPEAHYFTRSKHPWVMLPKDVPSFSELAYPDKPEAASRIAAALGGGPQED
jgi:hypothetical protein